MGAGWGQHGGLGLGSGLCSVRGLEEVTSEVTQVTHEETRALQGVATWPGHQAGRCWSPEQRPGQGQLPLPKTSCEASGGLEPCGQIKPNPHLQGFTVGWERHGRKYHQVEGVPTGHGGDPEARLPWEGHGGRGHN